MHKSFYASGFLYYLPYQQILLQQKSPIKPSWTLFGQKGLNSESPIAVFQKAVFEQLQTKIALDAIFPVYDYYKKEMNCTAYIFYAHIKAKENAKLEKKDAFMEWFSFKQTTKLLFSEQSKKDLIVSQRVIQANARDAEPAFYYPQ